MKLTRFEETRLISARALQLSLGAPPMIKASTKEESIFELAKEEFLKNVLPLAVLREYPDGTLKKIEVY